MMMIKKEKLTANKIYTLFFIRKTNVLPVKDVLVALGSTNAKQVFRLLSELAKKGIIDLNDNYDIKMRNHYILLQKVVVKLFQLQEVLLYILMSKIKELIQMDADSWYQNCCKNSKWTIDFDDVICTNCGRVLTDKIEAITVVA